MTDFLDRYADQLVISGRMLSARRAATRRRRWPSRRTGALLLAGAAIAAPALAATHPWDAGTQRRLAAAQAASQRHLRDVLAGRARAPVAPDDLPVALVRVFPVLARYPAAGSAGPADRGLVAAQTGPSTKLTRAVPAPPGAKRRTWYLTPGGDGLCLTDAGGGGCGPLALESIEGIYMIEAAKPPPGSKVDRVLDEVPLGLVSVLGLAPAGYTTITVTSRSAPRTVTIDANGLYDFVVAPGDVAMTLNGPTAAPVSVPIP